MERCIVNQRIKPFIVFSLLLLTVHFAVAQDKQDEKALIDLHAPQSALDRKPVLIAHRGGVITDKTPECSIAAIQLAKKQGYQMIELDIMASKDGIPIVFHDSKMKKACGVDSRITDLTADEIVKIHYLNTDQRICTLDQALAKCRSLNLGIMLDVKAKREEKFFKKIVALIRKHDLDRATVALGGDMKLREYLKDISLLTVTSDEFKKVQEGKPVDLKKRFWFGLPHRLPSEMVKPLQKNGAYVFPAINTFRYPAEKHIELARKDIERLSKAGVDGFQIDSVYKPLFGAGK